MTIQKLVDNPVIYILQNLRWKLEIGFDLEKEKYTLKVQGVPFEDLKETNIRIVKLCHQRIENNFEGTFMFTKFFLIFGSELLVLHASYDS